MIVTAVLVWCWLHGIEISLWLVILGVIFDFGIAEELGGLRK
jgi:hypothetical protein